MREDNNTDIFSNQRNDNSVDTFEQRVDHTVGNSPNIRDDHTVDNSPNMRVDHTVDNSPNMRNDHDTNITAHPVAQEQEHGIHPETPVKGNILWKVLFVVVLIGFLIAVGMIIKNKTETNPDKGTTVPVATENSVSVSDEAPSINETSSESMASTDITAETSKVTTTSKATEKFDPAELNSVINEIFTTVKATARTIYTLTLDSNGGNSIFDSYKIASNESITLPTAQRIYHLSYTLNGGEGSIPSYEIEIDCNGWSKRKDATYSSYSCETPYTPTSNETLYPVWTSVSTTVTSKKPTRSGYQFLGWSENRNATSPDYVAGDTIRLTKEITYLYAVWEKISYTLTYNANGGSGAPSSQTGSSSYNISSVQPTRSGYTFLGWSKSSSSSLPSYTAGNSITLSSNTTLYAVWQKISYTLTYNANGGSGTPSAQTGNSSYIISSTQPTRAGYKFLGWSKSSSASSASYSTGNTITLSSNTTLYAIWEQITLRLESYNGSSRVNIHRTGTKINSSTVGWPVSLPTVRSNVTGESGSGWETVSGNLVIDGFTMYITQPGEVKVRYKLIYKGYAYYSEVYTYNLTLYKHTSDENFIRKSPGESSEKTGKHVPTNYEIEIQKFQVDPNGCHLWGYVDYNGTKGWITCLVLS